MRVLGGFGEDFDENMLYTAFLPFGNIKEVFLPRDHTAPAHHRGYGFVEFEEEEDAKAAIDNMHMNEVFNHVLKCNFARPTRIVTAGVHTSSSKQSQRSFAPSFTRIVWEHENAEDLLEGESNSLTPA